LLINGKQTDQVSVLDRGIQYGDGLFETIAVIDGHCCLWERHFQRLCQGCERLGITVPDAAELFAEAEAAIKGHPKGVLKIIVTRGAGGRGYRPSANTSASRIVYYSPWPDYPEDYWKNGVSLRICSTCLGINPALAQLKHLNRLEQVLARLEWDDLSIFEGIMLDSDGRVVEGTMSNLFVIKNNILITPDLSRCGIAGVMRGLIIELAATLNIPVTIKDVGVDELKAADAIFISNSLIGILPAKELANQRYSLDPIFPALIKAVDEHTGGCS